MPAPSPSLPYPAPAAPAAARRWPWLAIGALAGSLPLLGAAAGLQTRYVLYGALGLALAAVTPYLAAAAGSLLRLLWICFLFSLQLEIAWAPIHFRYQKLAGPYGLLITPTLLLTLAIVPLWIAERVWGTQPPPRIGRRLLLPIAAMLATALVSAIDASDQRLAGFGVFELVSLGLAAAVTAYGCSSRVGLETFRAVLLVIVFVQSVALFVEQITGVQFSLAHGINADYGWAGDGADGRFAGTFGAPSVAAAWLAIGLFVAFTQLFPARPPRRAGLLGLLFGVGLAGLLLTRSRAVWIAFAIGSTGLGWRAWRHGRISRRAAAWLTVGALAAALAAAPLVIDRLQQDHGEAATVRNNLVRIALVMIADHPLTGLGINTATQHVIEYAAKADVKGWVFIVHNQFLLVAAETGLPGLAALLWLIASGIRAARAALPARDPLVADTAAVVVWGLLALCWALMLDHVSGTKTYALLFVLVGAGHGLRALAASPAVARRPERRR